MLIAKFQVIAFLFLAYVEVEPMELLRKWSQRKVEWKDASERNDAIKNHLRDAKPLSVNVRRRLWSLLAGLNTGMGDKVNSFDEIKKFAEQLDDHKSERTIEADVPRAFFVENKPLVVECGDNEDLNEAAANIYHISRGEMGSPTDEMVDILPKDLLEHTITDEEPRVDTISRRNVLRTILRAWTFENGIGSYSQGQHEIAAVILEIETDVVRAYALYKYIMKDMTYVYVSLLGGVFQTQRYFQMLDQIVSERKGPSWCVPDGSFINRIIVPNWMTLFSRTTSNGESRHVIIDQYLAFGFQFIIQMTAHFYVKYKQVDPVNTEFGLEYERSLRSNSMKDKIKSIMDESEDTAKHVRETHQMWENPPFVMDVWYMLPNLHLRP